MAAIIQPVRLGENRASLVAKELIAPPPASTAPNRVLVSTPTASLEEILPVSPECSPVVYDLPLDMSALLSSAETEGTNQEEVVTNDVWEPTFTLCTMLSLIYLSRLLELGIVLACKGFSKYLNVFPYSFILMNIQSLP